MATSGAITITKIQTGGWALTHPTLSPNEVEKSVREMGSILYGVPPGDLSFERAQEVFNVLMSQSTKRFGNYTLDGRLFMLIPDKNLPKDYTQGACGLPTCLTTHSIGTSLLKCGGCKTTYYCSKEHQKAHWQTHKPLCKQNTGGASKPAAVKFEPIGELPNHELLKRIRNALALIDRFKLKKEALKLKYKDSNAGEKAVISNELVELDKSIKILSDEITICSIAIKPTQ